ncbi:hypothetical protein ACHAXA_010935 [Cyclostephanos tholiformis]|uniref:Pentatricopeptide repeat-containing protein n=1 Tax=Cyclostephanos tholiformis TaxID=382380 RepID=A0ABD3R7D5_9STRA
MILRGPHFHIARSTIFKYASASPVRTYLICEGRRLRRRPPISLNFGEIPLPHSFSTFTVNRGYNNASGIVGHNQRWHEAGPSYTFGDSLPRILSSESGRDNELSYGGISSSNDQGRRDDGDIPLHDSSRRVRQFADAIIHLHREHLSLPPVSTDWLRKRGRTAATSKNVNIAETNEQSLERCRYLCRDVACLVSSLKSSINQGSITSLRGEDGYALMDSLGLAMIIFSETQPTPGAKSTDDGSSVNSVSQYEACLDVFDILRSLNLPIMASHYTYAIRAACRESRWKEATKLFLGQISGNDTDNPDFFATGGLTPIDEALAWEGLYALAVDTMTGDERGGNVGESRSKRVFDTAMQMCMISPSNQKSYILSAGTALGRAGQWRDCLDFAIQPKSISTYGPSIAAAAMLACLECSRFSEAIDAYTVFKSGNQSAASEWQWGGGDITAVKTLCRDLALRAMGGVKKGGHSQDAVILFGDIIREGHPVSSDALLGLAQSMENDGDWQSSVTFLKSFTGSVYRNENTTWQVVSELSDEKIINPMEQNKLVVGILASVMRVCNTEGQHGLAILMCSIVNNSYASQQKAKRHDLIKCGAVVNTAVSQKIILENQQISEAFIQSLYGLGCLDYADELSNKFQNGSSMRRRLRHNESAREASWINAFVAIDRVLKAINAIKSEGANISAESRLLFERGLSRAMEHCIDSNQSAAALELFVHASAILVKKDSSLSERVRILFGIENSYGERKESDEIFQHADIDLKNLDLSDALLAAIIKAYSKLGQSRKARSTFHDGMLHLDNPTLMTQSNNSALLAIGIDEGLDFLQTMNVKCVNPLTFSMVARRYAQNGAWPEIGEVYNMARTAGCISEELGLIAMQAVCESELTKGKITILRKIVDDVSGLVSMKCNDWIKSRYWTIKKYVGFHHARLLMRWNDPATSKNEELLFAVNEMRQCASKGIVVENSPLMCIVSLAELYGTDGQINSGNMAESQRQSSINLLLEASREARRSGFIKNHAFTAKVTRSLRSLNANEECIQIVSSLVSEGRKCNQRLAVKEAIYAASEERDHESL